MSAYCVFSSSSDAVAQDMFAAARQLGLEIGRRRATLVYGGARVGLMGAVARATQEHGGRVVGVIPEYMHLRGVSWAEADELIFTRDLRERKSIMEQRADAFLALPGGYGTLEEMLEIVTLKQLQQHMKPIVFLDIDNFYQPLRVLFEHMIQKQCAKETSRLAYHFAPDVSSAFRYLDHYEPPVLESKWFSAAEVSEVNTDRG